MMRRTSLIAGLWLAALIAGCDVDSPTTPDGEPEAATPGDIESGAVVRISYGGDGSQFGDLTLPSGVEPAPVAVLVHGGFWRTGFGLDLMEPLVPSLIERGYAVWNLEYRRVGEGVGGGGGYPETFNDVAAGLDQLAALPGEFAGRIDLSRVATVGHSAGGHLAVWLASRASLPPSSPWADPAVVPALAVPQAGALVLERCIADRVGGTACSDILGGADIAERIALGSPAALLPIDARIVAVHGTADRIVPFDQSEGYIAAASAAGVDATLVAFDGANHFDVITATHPAWIAVLDALDGEFVSG
jgi:acetyl esterase/lipase